jgi:hypothetical protein
MEVQELKLFREKVEAVVNNVQEKMETRKMFHTLLQQIDKAIDRLFKDKRAAEKV